MEFFEAFSKTIFSGKETTPGLTFYPMPENFALLLSRTHLTDEFEWSTKFAHPGRQFNIILPFLRYLLRFVIGFFRGNLFVFLETLAGNF